jgi:hypothetical protein
LILLQVQSGMRFLIFRTSTSLSQDLSECKERLVGIISRLHAAKREEVILPDADIRVSFRSGKLFIAQDSVTEYCRFFDNPLDRPANFYSNVMRIALNMVDFLMKDGEIINTEVCLSPQRFGQFKINRFVVKVV